MYNQEVIKESSSSWYFPVVLKYKKNGTFRFYADSQKLDDKKIKDSYTLPKINQT